MYIITKSYKYCIKNSIVLLILLSLQELIIVEVISTIELDSSRTSHQVLLILQTLSQHVQQNFNSNCPNVSTRLWNFTSPWREFSCVKVQYIKRNLDEWDRSRTAVITKRVAFRKHMAYRVTRRERPDGGKFRGGLTITRSVTQFHSGDRASAGPGNPLASRSLINSTRRL